MTNRIVQLVDDDGNNCYPLTGGTGPDTVSTETIQDSAVTSDKIADEAVTSEKIDFTTLNGDINTVAIADGAVTTAKLDMAGLLNVFYPVGSYYETRDTSFDPNTAWGGTWVKDTSGRVTVSVNPSDTDFNIINKTGGNKTNSHSHTYGIRASRYYGALTDYVALMDSTTENWKTAVVGGNGTQRRNSNASATTSSQNQEYIYQRASTTSTSVSTLQPYITVVRWYRTA